MAVACAVPDSWPKLLRPEVYTILVMVETYIDSLGNVCAEFNGVNAEPPFLPALMGDHGDGTAYWQ